MPTLDFKKRFSYELPEERIANEPLEKRDESKLLIVDRETGAVVHKHFYDLVELLTPQDVLVLNKSKVFPARLFGKKETGGKVEVLLIHQQTQNTWRAISKPGLKKGTRVEFTSSIYGEVISTHEQGEVTIQFSYPQQTFFEALNAIGSTPIPGYINTTLPEKELRKRYQTVYAKIEGSAAAPTAGLHFTEELLARLQEKGVEIEYVTLHVGLGTFQSLREENFKTGSLHSEYYEVSEDVVSRLNNAKKIGKRIIAVGTTSTRTLETIATKEHMLIAGSGNTNIFIYPPYTFNFVDSMITNFHLPQSSLLMLISAFATNPNTTHEFTDFLHSILGNAYIEAIAHLYRFFSFGDAMWIR